MAPEFPAVKFTIVDAVAMSGLTVGRAWFGQGGQTPLLGEGARFAPITFPGAAALADVPVIGPVCGGIANGHNVLVCLAAAAVPLVAWLVYRTRLRRA